MKFHKKVLFVSWLSWFVVTTSFSFGKTKQWQLNKKMTLIGHEMESLFPYIVNHDDATMDMGGMEADNSDPKKLKEQKETQAFLIDRMDRIVSLFKEVGEHFDQFKGERFALSYPLMLDHLEVIQQNLKTNHISYSRMLLKEVPGLCMTCHTQDRHSKVLFRGSIDKIGGNLFQQGEFHFMTRNYSKALESYRDFITKVTPQSPYKDHAKAVRRVITLLVKIYKRPETALTEVQRFKSVDHLPAVIKRDLDQWKIGLQTLIKDPLFKKNIWNFREITTIVKRYFPSNIDEGPFFIQSKNKVFYLQLATAVEDYLYQKNPTSRQVPQLLYWLSVTDRALNYNWFYSMADLYLKECMDKYTSDPFAKKCFEEYEKQMTFSFTGSAGTFVPDDIKSELVRYKKLIEKAQKK